MYISVSDLAIPDDVLVRLTDDEGSGMVNNARAEAAIASAQALVDSALSRLYDVPLASAPAVICDITGAIAVYNLYMRAGSLPAEAQARYKDAMGALDKAAQGVLCIGLEPPGPAVARQARAFTRELMEGF